MLLFVYGWVGFSSPGYDDEIFTIRWIEQLGFGAAALVQVVDVHPPGSYIANWLYYNLLGQWSWVRLLAGLVTACSLIYAIQCLRLRNGERAGWLGVVLLGLNPAFLLWCTSLRWYALFVPILIWLSFPPRRDNWWYWLKCCSGLFLLAYIGYIAFILAVPVLLLYWRASTVDPVAKFKRMLFTGVPFAVLYLYQLSVFFTAAVENGSHHLGTLPRAVLGYAVAHLSNQGVFPLSVPGIVSATGMAGLMVVLLWPSRSRAVRGNQYFLPYALGVLLMLCSGLAAHFRNLVVLSQWQGLWIATAHVDPRRQVFFQFFLACVLFANVAGIYNVISHSDTVKNSWNQPVAEVQQLVELQRQACGASFVVATHDPVMAYNLSRKGLLVLSTYTSGNDVRDIPDAVACLVVIRTYAGIGGAEWQDEMYGQLSGLHYSSLKELRVWRDNYYEWKRRLDPDYPEVQVEVLLYRDVSGIDGMTAWLPFWPELYRVR